MRWIVALLALWLGWTVVRRTLPEGAIAPSDVQSPAHDEWLLDEALAETFPASDPISPASIT